MATSFHSKLGEYVVDLKLKGLVKEKPRLGVDPDGKSITWDMLFEVEKSVPSTIFPAPKYRHIHSPLSKGLPVAIVGGGMAGLRVAMMLETLNIPYTLFEVSERLGGRVFTYHFEENSEHATTQNYFDVGAMRFPDNAANASTYDLFKELDITEKGGKGGKLIPYHLQSDNNILLFNDIRKSAEDIKQRPTDDHFNDGEDNGGRVPVTYLTREHTKRNGTKVYGADACLEDAYGKFKEVLANDWDEGWKSLMEQDHHSTRSYMIDVMKYPWSVVQWLERSDSGTAGFDHMGFVESVLESMEFDYPTGNMHNSKPEEIKWRCIEGGTETLTKAMFASLKHKGNIQTCKRVTDIAKIKIPKVDDPDEPTKIKVADHTIELPADIDGSTIMTVTVEDVTSESPFPSFVPNVYSHVVSTVPFACLRTIDLSQCGFDSEQYTAFRSLHYGPAVKVGIKFKSRWWQDSDPSKVGGSSKTDRQSRVVVYPNYGLDDAANTPGVLMATYNWGQDAFRYGSLVEAKDWSKVLDHNRKRPASEQFLLKQIFTDLSKLHGRDPSWYKEQMIDYYAYDWYHNHFTMGAYAHFGPGQFKNLYPSISKPASDGCFHFGGEAASYHHGWIAGALDSAWRCVYEIVTRDGTDEQKNSFENKYGKKKLREFENVDTAAGQYYRGLYANSLEMPGGNDGPFEY